MDQSIKNLLMETQLFDRFTEQQLNELLSKVEMVAFPAEHVFIKEFEKADSCYIVVEGCCQAFTHDENDQEIILSRIEAGAYVGEQALLAATPGYRSANVRTKICTTLIKISHAIFCEILEVDQSLKTKLKEIGTKQLLNGLQKLPSLYTFLDNLLGQIDFSNLETFEAGAEIISEGELSDGVHLIVSGKVDIYKKDNSGKNELITQLVKGVILGEVGVIKNQSREATAIANNRVRTIFIAAERFRKLHNENPQLQRIASALCRTYDSPRRGKVHRYISDFMGMNAVITNFDLPDGRQIYAASVIGENLRSIYDESEKDFSVIRFEKDSDLTRELLTANNLLVGVRCYGEWENLDQVYNMVFDRASINVEQLDHFKKYGEVVLPKAEKRVVPDEPKKMCCRCMLITRGEIAACINEGNTELEQIIDEIGAGSVCGACVPQIVEMLGHNAWQPVRITKIGYLTDQIHSYQLTPANNTPLDDYKPGQYIVIQCEINGASVERAYTLTSVSKVNNYYEIVIKREETGFFTSWIFENENNIKLMRISKPMGDFVLDTQSDKPAVCFLGGIGITPGLGFARSLAAENAARSLLIHHSVHSHEDVVNKEELEQLVLDNRSMSFIIRNTANEGRLQYNDIEQFCREYPNAEYFICGRETYEKAVSQYLSDSGVTPNRIFIEKFTPVCNVRA